METLYKKAHGMPEDVLAYTTHALLEVCVPVLCIRVPASPQAARTAAQLGSGSTWVSVAAFFSFLPSRHLP